MEKLQKIKESIVQFGREYKKTLWSGVGVLCVMMLLAMNLNVFEMMHFTYKKQTDKVIEVLNRDVKRINRQDDWYFRRGMEYIFEDLSEDSVLFIENNFEYFDMELQKETISVYNAKDQLLKNNVAVLEHILHSEEDVIFKKYMERLSIEEIEKSFKEYFGQQPKLTQNLVEDVYKLIRMQSKKMTLENFKLNVYELMSFPHDGNLNSIALKVLDYIDPTVAKNQLFTELKTKPIEIEEFATWVTILNKKHIITPAEYTQFTTSYGNIRRLQEQYNQAILQEVDLFNAKQIIDIQTEELKAQIEKISKEIETLEQKNKQEQSKINELKNYKTIELYVLDQYENGDIEAAIPEKSWFFGNYKPSNQKVRLKITEDAPISQGVVEFDVFEYSSAEAGVPCYIQVSPAQREEIKAHEAVYQERSKDIKEQKDAVAKIEQEIAQIHQTSEYEQTIQMIEEIERRKGTIEIDIKKEKLNIQNIFQIGQLIIEMK
ncbi:MAG: hypothetical protein ACRCSG_05140 [Cellulosilyticaceae bacterium]